MSKKIIIITLVVVLIIVLGSVVYFSVLKNKPTPDDNQVNSSSSKNTNTNQKLPTKEEQAAQIKKDYPKIVRGVISFLDSGKVTKTTVKADDGKEYTLWPLQITAVYESLGIKNGQRVEIYGRLNEQGNLEWASITPI